MTTWMSVTECRYCGMRKDDARVDPYFCKSSRRKDQQHGWDQIEVDPAGEPEAWEFDPEYECMPDDEHDTCCAVCGVDMSDIHCIHRPWCVAG